MFEGVQPVVIFNIFGAFFLIEVSQHKIRAGALSIMEDEDGLLHMKILGKGIQDTISKIILVCGAIGYLNDIQDILEIFVNELHASS